MSESIRKNSTATTILLWLTLIGLQIWVRVQLFDEGRDLGTRVLVKTSGVPSILVFSLYLNLLTVSESSHTCSKHTLPTCSHLFLVGTLYLETGF